MHGMSIETDDADIRRRIRKWVQKHGNNRGRLHGRETEFLPVRRYNKMRLVDADEIKLPQGFFEKVDNVPKFYEWLSTLPTVDAVEVVRCKYCKHSEHWYGDKRRCFLWNETGIDVFEDGYCSYGKRREDETC